MEFDFPIPHTFPLKEEEATITAEHAIDIIGLIGQDCWAFYTENDKTQYHVFMNSYATRYARGNANLTTSPNYVFNMAYEMEQFSRDCIFENRKKFIETLAIDVTVHMIFGYNTFEHIILKKVDANAYEITRYTMGSLKPPCVSK